MNRIGMLCVSALAGTCLTTAAHAASLVNGDLEQPGGDPYRYFITQPDKVTGWTYSGPSEDGIYESDDTGDGIAAQSGKFYVSFGHDGLTGGALSQSFNTVVGQAYTVSYWVTQQQGNDPTQSATASVTDSSSAVVGTKSTFLTMATGTWVKEMLQFIATTNSTTLTIADTTAPGAAAGANWALDTISVDAAPPTSTPLPATLPLFASGLAGLGWLARRRRNPAAV